MGLGDSGVWVRMCGGISDGCVVFCVAVVVLLLWLWWWCGGDGGGRVRVVASCHSVGDGGM